MHKRKKGKKEKQRTNRDSLLILVSDCFCGTLVLASSRRMRLNRNYLLDKAEAIELGGCLRQKQVLNVAQILISRPRMYTATLK